MAESGRHLLSRARGRVGRLQHKAQQRAPARHPEVGAIDMDGDRRLSAGRRHAARELGERVGARGEQLTSLLLDRVNKAVWRVIRDIWKRRYESTKFMDMLSPPLNILLTTVTMSAV